MAVEPPEPGPFAVVLRPVRGLLAVITSREPALELQIAGRTLLHAALIGLAAGLVGAAFFAGAELVQQFALEAFGGYRPLRAQGEQLWELVVTPSYRPWLLVFVPALGGLVAGLVARWSPEVRGGGGDATIAAFHAGGELRRRVIWAKPLASIATLGTGGAGGREGPTMLMGGALGSTVGRYLKVSARERRVLMVAGIAAGIAAVFRTPLGAALISIEMLYRDDFESEALVPAVLASVVGYSVSISIFGQSTLFGHLEAFPFRPTQLPLYVGLAVVISAAAALFVGTLRVAHRAADRLPVAPWARPAIGGLLVGVLAVIAIELIGARVGREGGIGVLGGGYGIAQVAITGASWLAQGWHGVELLVVLALIKIAASSLTIGSGGSAGDFAPALAIGAALGGAYGLAVRLLLDDPAIDPGAFALVGMAAFYGGIAKTPLAAVVMICELAGSYDLLVPLMLAVGLAFVLLRRVKLYGSQPATVRDSPVHHTRVELVGKLRCRDLVDRARVVVTVPPDMAMNELAERIEAARDQDVFPVVGDGRLLGLIAAESLRVVASNPAISKLTIAADLMHAPVSVSVADEVMTAARLLLERDLRAIPVVDETGAIVGLLDEHAIASLLVQPA